MKGYLFLFPLLISCTMVSAQLTPVRKSPSVITPTVLTPVEIRDIDFANGSFENGLTGWTPEGLAFNDQPAFGDNVLTTRVLYQMELNNGGIGGDYWKDQGYNVGRSGNFWIGTYEKSVKDSFFQAYLRLLLFLHRRRIGCTTTFCRAAGQATRWQLVIGAQENIVSKQRDHVS